MSLFPARSIQESIWQSCNYGYDTSKYKSYEDCLTKQGLILNQQWKPNPATYNANVEIAKKQIEEAVKKSRENAQAQKPRTFFEMNQGYIVIGLVLVAGYFAYKKFKK